MAVSMVTPDSKQEGTNLKQDSLDGCMTLWFMDEKSCLRGRDAGGGIGFVRDMGPLRDGTSRLLTRKSGTTSSACDDGELGLVVGYARGEE